MTINSGTRLSHYEILSPIGVGGMGEVYRARDSKLNRDVAIKVLPEIFAQDSDRLARFQREAQVLASLNHPNIAAIYGLEESDGVHALVMELVEGPTLDDRLAAGPMPVPEALAIARQIAGALEVAFERGIIHRDLKPANIKVTPEDEVKVLDFGLAKVLTDDSQAQDLSHSPTLIKGTAAGMILGTAAYMSPEQARGRAVDKRTDLWAFGVVLMEMLTGSRLFKGETVSDVIAAVLTQEADWSALPSTTPSPIRRLLRRCLQKDRRNRLSDAATAKLEIDDALSGITDYKTDQNIPLSAYSWRRAILRVGLPTALVTALVVAVLVWAGLRNGRSSSRPFTLTIVPPGDMHLRPVGTMASTPHISPDGSAVMFQISGQGLYVRRLDSLDLLKVPGSETVSNESFWHGSGDISFPSSGRQLQGVRLPDGAPETLMPLNGFTRGGSWSDTGILLVSGMSHLLTLQADGTVASISIPDQRPGNLVYPEFLPGGEDFLVLFKPDDGEGEVWIATLSKGAVMSPSLLFKNDTAARYTPWDGGRVLFVRNDNLYSQRLNRSSRAVEGQPELVVKGVASQPGLMRADFSVARDGTVAWRPGRAALAQVMVFDRKGAVITSAGPPGAIDSVFVSPSDDSRLLVIAEDAELVDVGQGGRLGLPRDTHWFNWSPDGKKVLGVQGGNRLMARPADNIGATDEIGQLPQGSWNLKVISPDGKSIIGRLPPSGSGNWISVSGMAGGSWTPLVGADESHADLTFSPDGRFVLYDAFPSGGIYVQPFPGPGRRILIDQRGIDPVWRGDGKEIVFVRDNAIWSVAVTSPSAGTPTFGSPERLFEGVRRAPTAVGQSQGLAVSRDGSWFFIVQGVEQPDTNVIHVMMPPTKLTK